MEPPTAWNLLTASLALCGPEDLAFTWKFLVHEGLVRDDPNDRALFELTYREETARRITGPSAAARTAIRIQPIVVSAHAAQPDPCAAVAIQHLRATTGWFELRRHPKVRDRIRRLKNARAIFRS